MGISREEFLTLTALKTEEGQSFFTQKQINLLNKFLQEFVSQTNLQIYSFYRVRSFAQHLYEKEGNALNSAGITIKTLDAWFLAILHKIPQDKILEDITQNTFTFVDLNFEQCCKFLIDIMKDVDIRHSLVDDHKQYYTLLMLSIEKKFESCIPILLEKTKDINATARFGTTALFLSIEEKNFKLTKILLEREDIEIKGRFCSVTLFDLLRSDKNNQLFDLCVKKLQKTFNASNYNWKEPLYIPIALLKKEQQSDLRDNLITKINQEQIFKDNLSLKKTLLDFLNEKKDLNYKRINRLQVVFECVAYLLHPEWIKQSNSNLCGPATVMQHLAFYQPELLVNSVLELAEFNWKPAKHLPKIIKKIPTTTRNGAFSILDLWMETIRNNYNVLLGYDKESRFEYFLGQTTPFQLEKMFEDFNYQIESETMQIQFSLKNTVGKVLDQFRRHVLAPHVQSRGYFKFYSFHHEEQQNDQDRFDTTYTYVQNHKKILPVLLSETLVRQISNLNEVSNDLLYFFVNCHYANIKDLKLSQDKRSVFFKMLTYGKEYNAQMDVDFFKKYFLGSIIVNTQEPTLGIYIRGGKS